MPRRRADELIPPEPELPPLVFVACCLACGEAISTVPVRGDCWREAEAWSYLASREHQARCRAVPPAAPPASR